MTTRTERFKALPKGGQIFVVVALVALGAWMWVTLSADDPAEDGCALFSNLADDVNAGRADATSDETIERLDEIGATLAEADGEHGDVGAYLQAQADTARQFPEERDEILASAVGRAVDVC